MSWLVRLKNENAPAEEPTKTTNRFSVVSVGPSPGHSPQIQNADAAAWIKRRRVLLHEKASPATLAKFARASADLDCKIADDDGVPDPDRWCRPNDPSPGAAMNGAELELFGRRLVRLLALGLNGNAADMLADRLKVRDREGDDRVSCAECRHARAQACPSGSPLPLAILHHCGHVQPA